jgi:hypothetical protein
MKIKNKIQKNTEVKNIEKNKNKNNKKRLS